MLFVDPRLAVGGVLAFDLIHTWEVEVAKTKWHSVWRQMAIVFVGTNAHCLV